MGWTWQLCDLGKTCWVNTSVSLSRKGAVMPMLPISYMVRGVGGGNCQRRAAPVSDHALGTSHSFRLPHKTL